MKSLYIYILINYTVESIHFEENSFGRISNDPSFSKPVNGINIKQRVLNYDNNAYFLISNNYPHIIMPRHNIHLMKLTKIRFNVRSYHMNHMNLFTFKRGCRRSGNPNWVVHCCFQCYIRKYSIKSLINARSTFWFYIFYILFIFC